MIRSNLLRLKASVKTLVWAIALIVLPHNAIAQSGSDLPRSTVEAISISGSHQTQINGFVQAWVDRALSDDPQDTKRAIEALTKPLNERGVSVAFRQAYTQAITPLMGELDSKGSIGATLASLRLAGDLATPSAATRVKSALGSDDPGIQLFAVSRAAQIFNATAKHGPAMTINDANTLINAIEELTGDQNIDPELFRACVRALIAGTRLSSKDMGDTRSRSIVALSDAVGTRLRGLNVNDDPSFIQNIALEAAGASTASISDIGSQTTPDAIKAAVGLGGDIISVSLRRVLGNTIPPVANRDLTVRCVQAGETLLYFALIKDAEFNNKPAGGVRQTKFADQLAAGNDKDFRNDASRLLGPGSDIVRRFGFADERFLR